MACGNPTNPISPNSARYFSRVSRGTRNTRSRRQSKHTTKGTSTAEVPVGVGNFELKDGSLHLGASPSRMSHAQLEEVSAHAGDEDHAVTSLRTSLPMATSASTPSSIQTSHTSAGRTAAALKASAAAVAAFKASAASAASSAAAASATTPTAGSAQAQTPASGSASSGQPGALSASAVSSAPSPGTIPDEEEEMECRICRCGEYDGKLLFPCSCRAPVHMFCLDKWIRRKTSELFPLSLSYASSYHCEVCLQPYNLNLLVPRYKLARQKLCGYCSVNMAIELGLFLSTFCLTCIGLAILWSHLYGPEEAISSPLEKLTLGLMNVALTTSLFFLFHRLVSRFQRDGLLMLDSRVSSDAFSTADISVSVDPLAGEDAGPDRSTSESYLSFSNTRLTYRGAWNYVMLGAGLGTTAAFEIYLIVRSL